MVYLHLQVDQGRCARQNTPAGKYFLREVYVDDFFDPTGTLVVEEHTLAPGLTTLEGKKLGILDNSKTNADRYLTMVAEELQELYGVADWRMVTKENLGSPARSEILEELVRDSDFIITGIGD